MGWVTSKGKAAPQATGQDSKKSQDELFEVKDARQEMKPVLIFFAKGRDVLNFGKKSKDREVETTAHFEKEIFGRLAITGMAKEFVNIKVDVRKADRKLLTKTYYIRRAPVVVILDFYGKVIYRLSSPKLNYRQLGKMMESAIKRVEKEVARLAKSDEDSDLCKRAKTRFAEIEMRDTLAKGLEYTYDKKWARAEKALKEVLDRKDENEYKKKAEAGMKELQAGKLFVEGERLYKKKRYKQSKEILDKVIKIRESKYFKQLATELLKKVNKKIR